MCLVRAGLPSGILSPMLYAHTMSVLARIRLPTLRQPFCWAEVQRQAQGALLNMWLLLFEPAKHCGNKARLMKQSAFHSAPCSLIFLEGHSEACDLLALLIPQGSLASMYPKFLALARKWRSRRQF